MYYFKLLLISSKTSFSSEISLQHLGGKISTMLLGIKDKIITIPFEHFVLDPWPYLLKRQSYKTAFSGIWPFSNIAQLTPAKMGFETYCRINRAGKLDLNGATSQVSDPIKATGDFAVDFIKANKTAPFMLYHTISYDSKLGMEASVREMDACVGRIQRTLIQEGLQQKTIIIFTADGASAQAGSIDFKLSKMPSGIKRPGQLPKSLNQLSNLGAQVPLIISAPFLIPKMGFYTRDLVDSSDFFPTIADLCGLRSSEKLDGLRGMVGFEQLKLTNKTLSGC